jgi:flagellar hook-associated protein 3 FlgL
MRISSNTFFESGLTGMLNQQAAMMKTQQELSSGLAVQTPSDNPVAAVQALDTQQELSMNTQYTTNRGTAEDQLSQLDTNLSSVTTLLQNASTIAVAANNASLSNADRASYATQLSSQLQQLLGLANATNDNGQYLFSGYQGNTQPFTQTATGASYAGDDGQRMVQISPSIQIPVSVSGADVFERVRNGNGTFTTSATGTNTGSGVITPGSVVNPALVTGDTYQINFTVAGAATTYDVVDTTTGTTVQTAQPYTSGNGISFDGMQMQISGTPANGDQFTVAPSTNQSIFTTFTNLINALNSPASTPTAITGLQNQVTAGIQNLSQALNNVLAVNSAVGARQNECTSLDTVGANLDTQYQTQLSNLTSVNYAQAASQLNEQQLSLEAAQKSFAQVDGLSLFNYITTSAG